MHTREKDKDKKEKKDKKKKKEEGEAASKEEEEAEESVGAAWSASSAVANIVMHAGRHSITCCCASACSKRGCETPDSNSKR